MIVWLASYPRSGNTFLRVILNQALGLQSYSLYDDVADIASHAETADVVGHLTLPRGFSTDKARAAKRRYLVKTHEHAPEHADRAIYVVRDGRASIASYQHYLRAYGYGDFPLDDFLSGAVDFGSWGDHVRSWDPLNRANTLLLKFETLVAAPLDAAGVVARFLGVRPRKGPVHTFRQLQAINPRMFRDGSDTGWADHFSYRGHAEFWRREGRLMECFGYERDVL